MSPAPRAMAVPLPDPPLADDRLVLRPWRPADAAALVAAWADPEVARWTAVPPQPDHALARRWIDGDTDRRIRGLSLDLVIEVEGEVAGEVGLSDLDAEARTAEIGWWVGAGHRQRGLATRAARLLAGWAVEELNVEAVVARCDPANPASGAVARSAGFAPRKAPSADDGAVWTFVDPGGHGTVPT